MQASGWLYLVEQTLTSACLIWSAGRCAGLRSGRIGRTLFLSLLLALVTMAMLSRPLPLRLLTLPLAALSPIAIWPDAPRRLYLRMAALGALLPLTFSGLMRLLVPLHLPGLVLLAAGCGGMFLASVAASRASPPPQCTTVEVRCGTNRASLTALVDSGNLLRDSVTGLPVIVISRSAAAKLIPLPADGTLLPGMRLLPVRTVSGVALMTILHPEEVRVRAGGTWIVTDAVIGLSPSGGEGFQALIPVSLASSRHIPIPPEAISQGG